jgi:hypothetical protein
MMGWRHQRSCQSLTETSYTRGPQRLVLLGIERVRLLTGVSKTQPRPPCRSGGITPSPTRKRRGPVESGFVQEIAHDHPLLPKKYEIQGGPGQWRTGSANRSWMVSLDLLAGLRLRKESLLRRVTHRDSDNQPREKSSFPIERAPKVGIRRYPEPQHPR